MNEMYVSVIIPTYNKKHRLKVVLESFNNQNVSRDDFEVVIVDDGSHDDTKEMIDIIPFNYDIKYITQENQGRSAARNKGIEKSEGNILIFCDDDTIPSESFIDSHRLHHQRSEQSLVHGAIFDLPSLKFFKDPINGIFFEGSDFNADNFTTLLNRVLPSDYIQRSGYLEKNKRISGFEKLIKKLFDEEITALKWMGCTGGNFSVKKCQIVKCGGFDEQFGKRWGCEDLELGYRLYIMGTHFVYCQSAFNYHITHIRGNFKEDIEKSVAMLKKIHPDVSKFDLENLLLGDYTSLHLSEFCI
jgi:glycosyltransferase involved in cell wall biosynthesis